MIKEVETASELMKILETENLTELVYENNGFKIQLKRDYKSEEKVESKKIVTQKENDSEKEKIKEKEKNNFVEILSHKIGHFYPASNLALGTFVKEGDEIGYILSMGAKNPVISDYNGEVIEIFIKEGDIVDFTKSILKLKK